MANAMYGCEAPVTVTWVMPEAQSRVYQQPGAALWFTVPATSLYVDEPPPLLSVTPVTARSSGPIRTMIALPDVVDESVILSVVEPAPASPATHWTMAAAT